MRELGYTNVYCSACLQTRRFRDTGNFLRCTAVGCTKKYVKRAKLKARRRRRP